MFRVAIEVFNPGISVIAKKIRAEIQSNQTAPIPYQAELFIRQIARMAANRAGIGMAGHKRPARLFCSGIKQPLACVGDINRYGKAFHFPHSLTAECRERAGSPHAASKLIGTVPGQRNHPHAALVQMAELFQASPHGCAAFHR